VLIEELAKDRNNLS